MPRARTQHAKQDRRRQLLAASLDEFFASGFAASRMEDIARRAGLSKGTLYLYFDSKEALFQALIEELAVPNIAQLEAISGQAPSLEDAINGIADFAPQVIRQSDMPRLLKVLIGDSHRFPDLIKAYRRSVVERVLTAMTTMLERSAARGELDIENAGLLARLVLAPILFSAIWQALFANEDTDDVDLEALFALHARLMLGGLRQALAR
ncbi:MAG: TetR/AcrR family transcriptional regulator [Halioglobus sp.]